MKASDSEIMSDTILKKIFETLMDVRDLFMKASPELRGLAVDSIVNLIEPMKTFHTFLEKLFQGILHVCNLKANTVDQENFGVKKFICSPHYKI